jgi:hypothetical protein
MISGMLAKAVMNLVAKQFKLEKILAYVEDPNDADKRIDELELDVFALKRTIKSLDSGCKCKCCEKPKPKRRAKK